MSMGCRGRELRRVEHDGVKGLAALDALAQAGVHVSIQKSGARFVKAVQAHMGLGTLDGRA